MLKGGTVVDPTLSLTAMVYARTLYAAHKKMRGYSALGLPARPQDREKHACGAEGFAWDRHGVISNIGACPSSPPKKETPEPCH